MSETKAQGTDNRDLGEKAKCGVPLAGEPARLMEWSYSEQSGGRGMACRMEVLTSAWDGRVERRKR